MSTIWNFSKTNVKLDSSQRLTERKKNYCTYSYNLKRRPILCHNLRCPRTKYVNAFVLHSKHATAETECSNSIDLSLDEPTEHFEGENFQRNF